MFAKDVAPRELYAEQKKSKNRLTMRYNMGSLKKIGELEDRLRQKLGDLIACDPDDLPVDFDLNEIYQAPSKDRVQLLV